MRIVGGRFGGHPLVSPRTQAIRPTADRLRESLFNVLVHGYADRIIGARVLDLFAGTGALGCEALSRGCGFVLFVDQRVEARALIRANVAALGVGGVTRVFRRDATRLGQAHPIRPFSLIFADPPYGHGLAEQALLSAHTGSWLASKALAVVEEASGLFQAPEGFEVLDRRTYDHTELTFVQYCCTPGSGVGRGLGSPPK